MNVKLATGLERAGYAVLRFDCLGSGDSEGVFEADTFVSGWQEDLRQVMKWFSQTKRFCGNPLILYGHSLGGLLALTYQDTANELHGRIVFAPVVDAVENFRDLILGPELWEKSMQGETIANFCNKFFRLQPQFARDLESHQYAPLSAAAKLSTPLLIIHGTEDAVVPIKGSQRLYAQYAGPKIMQTPAIDHLAAGEHDLWISLFTNWLNQTFRS